MTTGTLDGTIGKGFDMIAGFPVAPGVAGNPLRSPGEGDGGHASVAKLAECRPGAAGSCFPP